MKGIVNIDKLANAKVKIPRGIGWYSDKDEDAFIDINTEIIKDIKTKAKFIKVDKDYIMSSFDTLIVVDASANDVEINIDALAEGKDVKIIRADRSNRACSFTTTNASTIRGIKKAYFDKEEIVVFLKLDETLFLSRS